MTDSYMGRILEVDLSTQTNRVIETPQSLKDNFVGGKGFGAKLLYDLLPPQTDPLSPESILMFLTGPLTATAAPCMRACVVCKSPLTGGYLDSFFGGHFGPEIKYAGYDGLIIRGKSDTPVYLGISDQGVSFNDAGSIWGQDALEANRHIKMELAQPDAKVVTIGQAGEQKVLFALICCEHNRQAGRGGSGAVMGAKNLKGIAVKGSKVVKVHNAKAFTAAVAQANLEIQNNEECAALTDSGTSYSVPWSSAVGTLPTRNYTSQVFSKADGLGDAGQKKHLFLGKAACFACPIRCTQMGAVRTGKHAHTITEFVEYESAAMIGSNLEISDIRAVAHLTKLCDLYGMDSISAGAVIGFAFEAAEKGIIESPDGIPLTFGSVAGAEYLIKAIAYKENELGQILGMGVKRAADCFQNGSDSFALHVKGMEIPGWAPRGTPGMGLAYMTSDRGACHNRSFMVAYELGGKAYMDKPVGTYGLEQKAEILKKDQDYNAGTDTLVTCAFPAFGVCPETYADLLSSATGRPFKADDFSIVGERIWNLTRLFNLREGWSVKDDRLPRRIVEEPLEDGPHKGQRISEADMTFLLKDYYQVRNWNENGIPTDTLLQKLGLDEQAHIDYDFQPLLDDNSSHDNQKPI